MLSGNQSRLHLSSCFFSCRPYILPLISQPLLPGWHPFCSAGSKLCSSKCVEILLAIIPVRVLYMVVKHVVSNFLAVSWFWYQISYSCGQPVRCLLRFLYYYYYYYYYYYNNIQFTIEWRSVLLTEDVVSLSLWQSIKIRKLSKTHTVMDSRDWLWPWKLFRSCRSQIHSRLLSVT